MLIYKSLIRSRVVPITIALIMVLVLSYLIAANADQSLDSEMIKNLEKTRILFPGQAEDNILQNTMMKERIYFLIGTGLIIMFLFLFMQIRNYLNLKSQKFLDRYLRFNSLMRLRFHQSERNFKEKLSYHHPSLTTYEIELAELILEYISSKEIAQKLNITPASVNTARYRIRKKLGLEKNQDLVKFLQRFN